MKIEGIKKIAIAVEGGGSPDEMTLWPEALSLEFIYGIGTSGLSPFEIFLSDREAGEILSFRIKRDELVDYFMRLRHSLPGIPDNMGDVYFRIKVSHVSEAEQKEVIKAMAEMTACGDTCCGGH
ncbi:hypothetical protein ACFL2O_06445 [Thermodesulfobacteriota bacterium]